MNEIEKTYLLKTMPSELDKYPSKEIIDIYFPKDNPHPAMRIRKNGNKYEITHKHTAIEGDASHLIEQTIILTEEEFKALSTIDGLRVHKVRYNYDYKGLIAEIDIFKDDLEGLVLVDFEFKDIEQKDSFEMPTFCLADVTQEEFIAGGKICGKKYSDIENQLERFNYKKVL